MSKQLTPKDLIDPSTVTGYKYVFYSTYKESNGTGGSGGQPYRADLRPGDPRNGPRRATALEAAQDRCDYVNGNPQVPQAVSYAAPPVDLGVTVHRKRRKKRKGEPFVDSKHDLYDVEMFDPITGVLLRRKVGITASGDGRYSGYAKTFGLGFRPRTLGVTYPCKKDAEKAEAILIRTIEKDPAWVKVGKESFAPAPTKGDA